MPVQMVVIKSYSFHPKNNAIVEFDFFPKLNAHLQQSRVSASGGLLVQNPVQQSLFISHLNKTKKIRMLHPGENCS